MRSVGTDLVRYTFAKALGPLQAGHIGFKGVHADEEDLNEHSQSINLIQRDGLI